MKTKLPLVGLLFITAITGCERQVSLREARAVRTFASDGTNANIQAIHDTQAVDGDTITIPAGTFNWTTNINFTKAVTLQGQTTVDAVNGTANDRTIIKCSTSNGQVIRCTPPADTVTTFPVRITGLTFMTGAVGVGNNGTTVFDYPINGPPSHRWRYDHNHFASRSNSNHLGVYGPAHGVMDHNLCQGINEPLGNSGQSQIQNGHGNFGDPDFVEVTPWGSADWVFVEDNYFDNRGSPINSPGVGFDSMKGGKTVFRHNKFFDVVSIMHGTGHASGRRRGGRAHDWYNNELTWTEVQQITMDGIGSGTMIVHDNVLLGPTAPAGWGLAVFRAFNNWGVPWQGATGEDTIDSNVTEADGTHVEGHPPFVFQSGTVNAASVVGGQQFLSDNTKNWTANQWAGYTANQNGWIGLILSNTNNQLTMFKYVYGNGFAAGQPYKIQKVFQSVDQPGASGGELLGGSDTTVINVTTGTRSWPHQTIEGCYSWNNIHQATGRHINFTPSVGSGGSWLLKSGRDYFQDTVKSGYVQYTYPHPLVSNMPAPSPSPTVPVTPVPVPTGSPTVTATAAATATASATVTSTATIPPSPTSTATATATTTPIITPAPSPTIAQPTPAAPITLWGTGAKDKGELITYLNWSGTSAQFCDIYRNGKLVASVQNDGEYTDVTGAHGHATFTYKVCDSTALNCSNETQVNF